MTAIEKIRKTYKKTNNDRAKSFLDKFDGKAKRFERKNKFADQIKYIIPDDKGQYRYWNTVLVIYWECINPDAKGNTRAFKEGEIYYNPEYESIMEEVINEEIRSS